VINIRDAQKFEIPKIVSWSVAMAHHEHEHNPHTFVGFKTNFEDTLNTWLTSMLSAPHALINIASVDKTPAGFSLGLLVQANNPFCKYPFHGVIQLVWVERQYRRLGIAQKLIEQQESFLRGLQVPYIEIQYSHQNPEGESFWKKMGYLGALHTYRKFY
jgi:ribosomal protein S18 acetylase RimI-like enzyme